MLLVLGYMFDLRCEVCFSVWYVFFLKNFSVWYVILIYLETSLYVYDYRTVSYFPCNLLFKQMHRP
jgi:hypothetical protein